MSIDLDLSKVVTAPEEEFKEWFRNYCPAESEISPAFAAGVCIRCKHNIRRADYKDRCEILNMRTK